MSFDLRFLRVAGPLAGGLLCLAASHASASICNDFMETNWIVNGGSMEVTDLNQTGGFIGCATQSVLSGNASFTTDELEDGEFVVLENAFNYSISALDGDTIRVQLAATVDVPEEDGTFLFPGFTLELTDIQWTDSPGSIESVTLLPFSFFVEVTEFTADSITFRLNEGLDDGFSFGQNPPLTGETFLLTADFGIVVTHAVPEPGTLALFAFGLAGLGAARWRGVI